MKPRCIWCNKGGDDLNEIEAVARNRFFRDSRPRKFIVHRAHEAEFRAFNDRVQRLGGWFLGLLAVSLFAILALQFVLVTTSRNVGLLGIGTLVFLMGAALVAMPFATPETVSLMGIKGAVRLVRITGVITAGLGMFVIKLAAG